VVHLPGRWLASNAAFAVATAVAMGVEPRAAVAAATGVADVDGRYRPLEVDGRRARLFLVKNPASWAEAVSLAADGHPVVVAMESFSVRDLTPGWDVDLDALGGTDVVATGQRRLDVSAMLEVAGVGHRVVEDPVAAIRSVPPGPVHVIANYTAFKDLRRRLAP
jgi:UDP-N-acetylmuramyl tripeptide synthase